MLRLAGGTRCLTTCTGARDHRAEIPDVRVMRNTPSRPGTGPVTLLRTPSLAQALQALELDMQIHVAKWCKERLFVHAGVVEWKGRAIVIPGLSGTGKTALVVSLLKAGAIYYSDEYAAFDREGRVHPYARPLRIRSGREKLRVGYPPETLGAVRGIESLPLGLVVVTQYCAGGEWRPRVLSPGRALLALLANTVSVRRQPDFALATLQRAMANTLAIESCRGEADEVPASLFKQLEDHVAHLGRLTEP
jgi:hypothetical protein